MALDLLSRIRSRGSNGAADLLAARALAGEWPLDDMAVDIPGALAILRPLAKRGNVDAMTQMLRLDSKRAIALPDSERDDLTARITAADPVRGRYWRGLEQLRYGPVAGIGGALALLEQAAGAGDTDALLALGDAYVRGVPDGQGQPTVATNSERGLEFYRQALARGDEHAAIDIARLYMTGVFGAPDPQRASQVLETAMNQSSDMALMQQARNFLAQIERRERLIKDRPSWEVAGGDPQAPVSLIAYLPANNPEADTFYHQILGPVIADLGARGFIHWQIRLGWALPSGSGATQTPLSIAGQSAALLRCTSDEARLSLLDCLTASPQAQAGDIRKQWVAFLRAGGGTGDSTTMHACLQKAAAASDGVEAEWRAHSTRNHIDRLPLVLVNGEPVPNLSARDVGGAVISAVPPRLWHAAPAGLAGFLSRGPAQRAL